MNFLNSLELYPAPIRSLEPKYSKWRVRMRKYLLNKYDNSYDRMMNEYKAVSNDNFLINCKYLVKDMVIMNELPKKIKKIKENKEKKKLQKKITFLSLYKRSNLDLYSITNIISFL